MPKTVSLGTFTGTGSSQSVLAANANRAGVLVSVVSTGQVTVKFGTAVSSVGDGVIVSGGGHPYYIRRDDFGDIVLGPVRCLAAVGVVYSVVEIVE